MAIFSVVLAVLVRPLAVPAPDQVVSVTNAYPGSAGAAGDGRVGASVRHYLDRLQAIEVLAEQALYTPVGYSLDEQGLPALYGGLIVTPSFFSVAGVPPVLGRTFTDLDTENGNHRGDLQRFPESRRLLDATRFHTIVAPLRADMVGDVGSTLYLLWGGALFVLLIGCVNLTNLLVIRATTRRREFGLRHAFGASRWRLARQLVGESVLLTMLGALLGVPLGVAALELVVDLGASALPRGSQIGVDGLVVLLAVGTSVAIGVLLGLVSFWRVSSASTTRAFRQDGRSTTGDRTTRVVGNGLVAVQISTAFILLIGAVLMLSSLNRVLAIAPGFDTERLLTARVTLPSTRYPTAAARRAFVERAGATLRGVAGVEQVGVGSALPFGCTPCPTQSVFAEGVAAPEESFVGAPYAMVDASYFDALGIRLVEGRVFDARDTASSALTVIVDEDLARALWPDRSPVGRRVSFDAEIADDTRFYTVVGVVAGHALRGLVDRQARRGVHYLPLMQHNIWYMAFTIRTTGHPQPVTASLRAVMTAVDPELPLFDIRTMDQRISATLALRRLPTVLSSGFACVAVFLAALGIYGLVAYRVTRRTKELAIRIALGSTAGRLLRLVIAEGVGVLGVGLVFGTAGALAVRDLLSSQLYDSQVTDVRVFLAVAVGLSTVTALACVLPARRVVSIDPISALNND